MTFINEKVLYSFRINMADPMDDYIYINIKGECKQRCHTHILRTYVLKECYF
jgi:hypothetical protein